MDQAAEDLAASYSRRGQVPDRGCGDVACVRWPQVPGPVRTMPVIVRDVVIQHRPQVPRPGDQHPIGALGPDCAHPTFRQSTWL